ncbi:hypothetical protein ACWKWA_01010 [Dermacoccus abyssi]
MFGPAKVAVFVDGCFWHGCPEHGSIAKANADFWSAKIERNRARDADTDARLAGAGWTVVRIWEHTPLRRAQSSSPRRWWRSGGAAPDAAELPSAERVADEQADHRNQQRQQQPYRDSAPAFVPTHGGSRYDG